MIGVLGGMGPAATIDFMTKVTGLVQVERDQAHVPMVVLSDPRVPDRVGPILGGTGCSPLPAMLAGLRRLEAAGATCIAMPCHTAHAWQDDLVAATALPFLGLVEASLDEMARLELPAGPVGLLATRATLKAQLYQERLAVAGWPTLELDGATMDRLVLPAIALVKRGRAAEGAPLLLEAVGRLQEQGAGAVLLACTELPVALAAAREAPVVPCVDATEALARACVAWWQTNGTL